MSVMQNAKLPASFALIVEPSDRSKSVILFYVTRNSGSPAAATTADSSFTGFWRFGVAEVAVVAHDMNLWR